MVVQEFLRAYFSLGSKVQNILVQKNNGTGQLEMVYSSNDGYHERWMRPEVRSAEIKSWGIDTKPPQIWISI